MTQLMLVSGNKHRSAIALIFSTWARDFFLSRSTTDMTFHPYKNREIVRQDITPAET
jgi:hypothetical protein